jgi:hypothetical protein
MGLADRTDLDRRFAQAVHSAYDKYADQAEVNL